LPYHISPSPAREKKGYNLWEKSYGCEILSFIIDDNEQSKYHFCGEKREGMTETGIIVASNAVLQEVPLFR
jgi:hypothetical protein